MVRIAYLSPAPRGEGGLGWYSTGDDILKGMSLEGKTIIVTGANSGIGKATASALARHGAFVVLACRDLGRAEEAKGEMVSEGAPADNLLIMQVDLSSFASIRKFTESFKALGRPLNVLINNAAVLMTPPKTTEVGARFGGSQRIHTHTFFFLGMKDGFELQSGVGNVGAFLLTYLLFGCLKDAGKGARIVNVSSNAHYACFNIPPTAEGILNDWFRCPESSYQTFTQYCRVKAGNIMFTEELQRRFGSTDGIVAISLHPGAVDNGHLGRAVNLFAALGLWKDPAKGCSTSVFAACSPIAADYGGLYLDCCSPVDPSSQARNTENAQHYWEACEMATGVKW